MEMVSHCAGSTWQWLILLYVFGANLIRIDRDDCIFQRKMNYRKCTKGSTFENIFPCFESMRSPKPLIHAAFDGVVV